MTQEMSRSRPGTWMPEIRNRKAQSPHCILPWTVHAGPSRTSRRAESPRPDRAIATREAELKLWSHTKNNPCEAFVSSEDRFLLKLIVQKNTPFRTADSYLSADGDLSFSYAYTIRELRSRNSHPPSASVCSQGQNANVHVEKIFHGNDGSLNNHPHTEQYGELDTVMEVERILIRICDDRECGLGVSSKAQAK
ncbi:hypothetical protein DM02DRAFT_657282 [Periconia macrospinosa]|uniref:Uncharacterized protein n=1 Tax=Periconia macrospinosa TaxID=97972 RepID=A0A2V1DK87_9PLEO|nr:hypothetical protein DM02DRAFT_657282 [Periconia macrospinosa]